MAVILGINSTVVLRLSATWKVVKQKEWNSGFKKLEDLLLPDRSFLNYRTALAHSRPPIIPHL